MVAVSERFLGSGILIIIGCPFCHSVVSSSDIENKLPETIEDVNNSVLARIFAQSGGKGRVNVGP